jgi:N-acetylmuramic acid 6-phosphate etherase
MARREIPSTEAPLEEGPALDGASSREIVAALHAEDRRAFEAVAAALDDVARAADVLAAVLDGGGRWFYAGAGTSGRLACADAAELPPTFGIEPERVVGVMAGGAAALSRAQEGAEDDAEAARRALAGLGLGAGDAVVAVSASGSTPFALAALDAARAAGARRIAVTCDPGSPLAGRRRSRSRRTRGPS